MKNINYVINGVLAIAVLMLFILHFTGNNNIIPSSGTVMTTSEEHTLSMPVAYINVDSLLNNYFFFIDNFPTLIHYFCGHKYTSLNELENVF